MRRLFWMAVGAGATVYVIRRSKAGLAAFLPSPLSRFVDPPRRRASHRAANQPAAATVLEDLADSAAEFVTDFRAAAQEREEELLAGVLNDGGAQRSAGAHRKRGGDDFDDFELLGRSGVKKRNAAAYDLDDLDDPDYPLYEF